MDTLKMFQKFRLTVSLLILTLLTSYGLFAQLNDENIYLLVGLSDFNKGPVRQLNLPDENNKINEFYANDTSLVSLYKRQLEIAGFEIDGFEFRKINTIDGLSGPAIYSTKYSSRFNSFFRAKYLFYRYEEDTDFKIKIYSLVLKRKKFKSLNQKLLFLKGLFTRYGNVRDGVYQIKVDSDGRNMRLIKKLIKDTDSKILHHTRTTDLIPGTQTITFMPSMILKDFISNSIGNMN
ncbi:MAG: hypothetical protein AAGL34_14965 [Bacteroidota bacterium]